MSEDNDQLARFLQEASGKLRGDDQGDLEQRCLKLCQTFLPSYWSQLSVDDIEVERLTGGSTNQIYRCRALTTNGVDDNETQEVVVKFYGKKYDMKTTAREEIRYHDGLVAWMASVGGFGPKVYGLFEGGQVIKYYKVAGFSF